MLREKVTPPVGRYDRVEAFYDCLKGNDREIFRQIIEDPEYTHKQIADIIRSTGHEVDRKQVQWFREKLQMGKFQWE